MKSERGLKYDVCICALNDHSDTVSAVVKVNYDASIGSACSNISDYPQHCVRVVNNYADFLFFKIDFSVLFVRK